MTPFTRRKFLAASALLAGSSQALHAQAKPNIVIIVADDVGYGDLSCYGARDLETPNLDALAKAGMQFRHFYANSPVCSPTRAALLSGMYPDRAGVPGVIRTHAENSWGYLSSKATLLPEVLRTAGYHTAAIGKWHLGLESPNTPKERGFDHFHGFLGDMMDDYYNHLRHGNNYMRLDRETIEPKGHATDLFTDWSIDYLNSRKGRSGPFFLYVAYNAPHTPIQPPEDWLGKVRRRQTELAEKRARLVALIEHLDAGIGRVVSALKSNGQMENTLLLFVSDNGGQLDSGGTNGRLRGGKQDMYEGGIRVPMFAVWPGKVAAGLESDTVALTMDLYATACEAAGAGTPADLDSVSILAELTGRKRAATPRDLVWVRREGGGPYRGRDYYAIRRGDWKLLQNTPFEPYQLFNLREDPAETTDLSGTRPDVYRALTAALSLHIQRAGRTPWQPPA
jgi:arylsulfatase A-like enzyme